MYLNEGAINDSQVWGIVLGTNSVFYFPQKIPLCPICRKDCPSNELEMSNSMSKEDYLLAHKSDAASGNSLGSVALEVDPAHPNMVGPGCSSGTKPLTFQGNILSTFKAQLQPLTKMIILDPPDLPILKPDIVFFGENLGDEFHESVAMDKNEADLLIMIGSSLKVRPKIPRFDDSIEVCWNNHTLLS